MKYKVGDKVKIHSDLKRGQRYGTYYTTAKMRALGGKIARIIGVNEMFGTYQIDLECRNHWTDEMLEDKGMEVQGMDKRVVIETYENYVIARCGDKEGIACCHPDDKFNFYTGAKLALERLEEAEKPYGWLKKGVRYYYPSPSVSDLYNVNTFVADSWDKRAMERGLAFKTREEAVECAKKMLKAVERRD